MFVYLVLFHSVEKIFHLDSHLALIRLVPDERVLEELVCVRPLVVVLHQDGLDEVLELGIPPLGLESRRGISRDQEERPHRMHVAQRRLSLGHLQRRDAQAPQVGAVVIGGIRVLITSDDLKKEVTL